MSRTCAIAAAHPRRLVLAGVLAVIACVAAIPDTAAPAAGALVCHSFTARASGAEQPPRVQSEGARVRALWQAPLTNATVSEHVVVGLSPSGELEALSALTGRPIWRVALPASEPVAMGTIVGGGVVVVQVGRHVSETCKLVRPSVARDVVFAIRSGRELWSMKVAEGSRSGPQHQPIAYGHGLLVSGNAAGDLTARNARTGSVVWRRGRPRACRAESGSSYDERLAADGSLLAVSYHCAPGRDGAVLVERLAAHNGARLWRWTLSRQGSSPGSLGPLSVIGAAAHGDLVLLSGQVSRPYKHTKGLPRPRPGLDEGTELLVALNARTGKPRWTELGEEQQDVELSDGVTCEVVHAGFGCRDDRSGRQSRPVVEPRGEANSPPYEGDAYAGISGNLAGVVLSQAPAGAVSVGVFPLRGESVIARATVQLGNSAYGGEYSTFIVGAGPLPGGATLLLLRRVDVAGYPLVGLRVTPSSTH
jgi:PQQ-like domain